MAEARLGLDRHKKREGPPRPDGRSPSYGPRGLLCKIPGLRGKALGKIRPAGDTIWDAELHWYKAQGIGRKEIRVKHLWEKPLGYC